MKYIDAKDLMIGDWVNVTAEENIVRPDILSILPKKGKVVGIDCDCIYVDFVEHPFMLGDIEPIPLTPEILEKNGFKEEQLPIGIRKTIWESEDTRTEIVLYMDDTMPMEIRKNIYYEDEICYTLPFVWAVHQLQHLIRLCDINKTIEL